MLLSGIVSKTFQQRAADEVIALCQRAGLKGIEWSENCHVWTDDPDGTAALYEKTVRAGLAVAGYGSYFRLGEESDPKDAFMKSLLNAEILHAPYIRIWAGNKPSAEISPQERTDLAREAAQVCSIAAGQGIAVALEWHRNTLTDTNESATTLLDEVDHPNLFCLWQPTCALSVEERCRGIDLLEERRVLKNLHVYYWPEQGLRRPLREGTDLWRTYLSHVDPSFTRYALLEFVRDDSEEQFLADAETLHALGVG